ncbi:MAG TPA: hypothetical protein PLK90_08875 [Clostridiales bacterium]|jgi:hypothetical protein|nr:hypothetical protein [Clostridiales bacterium]HQP70497.1 hypothetical protein [Clostridiales bacterium]
MIELKKAYPDDIGRIIPLLYDEFGLEKMSGRRLERQKESFRKLFGIHWNSKQDHIGYILEEDKKISGFIAYIFSERMILDKIYKFCNMSAWAVRKGSRSSALSLTMPVKELIEEGYTITNLSPSPSAYDVFRKLHGFRDLETHYILIPYIPSVSRRSSVSVSINEEVELSGVSDFVRKNYEDSAPYGAQMLHIRTSSDSCSVIFKKTYYKRYIPASGILFVSDPEVFIKNIQLLRSVINRKSGTAVMITDSRFINGKNINFSYVKKMHNPKLFWSERFEKDRIDNLYSENLL